MIYQSNKKLHSDIQKWGCYFLDILHIFEIESKVFFDSDEVNNIYKLCRKANFVGKEAYINEKGISGVASVASGLTGVHVYMRRVTSNDHYNNIISKYQRRTNSGKLVNHFVLADFVKPSKLIAWDPWSKTGSRTGQTGYIVGYRYIFAEAI